MPKTQGEPMPGVHEGAEGPRRPEGSLRMDGPMVFVFAGCLQNGVGDYICAHALRQNGVNPQFPEKDSLIL